MSRVTYERLSDGSIVRSTNHERGPMNDSHDIFSRDPLITVGARHAIGLQRAVDFQRHSAELAALDRQFKMYGNPSTKQIRVLIPFSTFRRHEVGEILDILSDGADRLIASGHAEAFG